jgi:KaiC/GvpD/RAD55 family RecA-like ATPase
MLAGRSWTGKTLFGAQFIYTGVKVYCESGLYVTFEQRPEDIIADIKETFGWDLKELVESNFFIKSGGTVVVEKNRTNKIKNWESKVILDNIQIMLWY